MKVFNAPDQISEQALWFIFNEQDILLTIDQHNFTIPSSIALQSFLSQLVETHYLGTYHHIDCYAAKLQGKILHPMLQFISLRQAYSHFAEELLTIAAKAKHILYWDTLYQYCTSCSQSLSPSKTERAKICLNCNKIFYPTISPAVIVLVSRSDEILLGRSPHFSSGVYSALAGFIEPGESAEACVEREVFEEAGIQVQNIRYYSSQLWPFPNSLMLAFYADYKSGEIVIDKNELEDAQWFHINALPKLPTHESIAYKLIENYLDKKY